MHDLVRRNTHQAQIRQKEQCDKRITAKPYAVEDAVWVFCHVIPKRGTSKLLRGWRGPYKVTSVLQDGRVYVLDTGQKVHFERLKRHVSAAWEWTTDPTPDRDVAIIADPYPEQTVKGDRLRRNTAILLAGTTVVGSFSRLLPGPSLNEESRISHAHPCR